MYEYDMIERDKNNLPAEKPEETEQPNDELIPADAWPLCPKCLTPCNPLQNYCGHCDSNEVINPLASYMPFVRIRFNVGMLGKLWRKILYDEHTSIVWKLLFLFLIIWAVLIVLGRR
jgi:hypothetical protein